MFLAQRPLLLRMLTVRLQSADDAEDVLQDLWLKLDQISSRPINAPASLLFRAAVNLATDRRIANARRSARNAAWAGSQPGPDETPGIERALISREMLHQANETIARMPPRMATALRLYRIEGVGQREIAEQLGISISAVEKLLRKAYQMLATLAKKQAGAEVILWRRHGSEGRLGRDD